MGTSYNMGLFSARRQILPCQLLPVFGKESQTIVIAQNMVNGGFPPEKVASITGLDL